MFSRIFQQAAQRNSSFFAANQAPRRKIARAIPVVLAGVVAAQGLSEMKWALLSPFLAIYTVFVSVTPVTLWRYLIKQFWAS